MIFKKCSYKVNRPVLKVHVCVCAYVSECEHSVRKINVYLLKTIDLYVNITQKFNYFGEI